MLDTDYRRTVPCHHQPRKRHCQCLRRPEFVRPTLPTFTKLYNLCVCPSPQTRTFGSDDSHAKHQASLPSASAWALEAPSSPLVSPPSQPRHKCHTPDTCGGLADPVTRARRGVAGLLRLRQHLPRLHSCTLRDMAAALHLAEPGEEKAALPVPASNALQCSFQRCDAVSL